MSSLATARDLLRLVIKALQRIDPKSATDEILVDYCILLTSIIRLSGYIVTLAQHRLPKANDALQVGWPKSDGTEYVQGTLHSGPDHTMLQALSATEDRPCGGGRFPMKRLGKACDLLRLASKTLFRLSPKKTTCPHLLLHYLSELPMVINQAKCIERLANDLLKKSDDRLYPEDAVDDGNTSDDERYDRYTHHHPPSLMVFCIAVGD